MRRTKEQKGITLIALIITIVVLLILAAVAINSIQNDGLIQYAKNATNTWNKVEENESTTLGKYEEMLEYHNLVASGKAWTQNGTTITRNGSEPLTVGDEIAIVTEEGNKPYSANGVEEWRVLGVENGKLLLVSASNVADVKMGGKYGGTIMGVECVAGYYNGVEKLNELCEDYLDNRDGEPNYADKARSLKIEDINKVAGFKPEDDTSYLKEVPIVYEEVQKGPGFYLHIDGTELTSSSSMSITQTFYNYALPNVLVEMFPTITYCASTCVHTSSMYTEWGFFAVHNGHVSRIDQYVSTNDEKCGVDWVGPEDAVGYGLRPVVALKATVNVEKVTQ